MLKLGLLDFGFFDQKNVNSHDVLESLVDLVPLAEELGYSRYWLAEHYENGVAWRNPNLLVSILCGLTDRIKIGPAGILLHLHSPLKVAQDYKLLEYLFNGRVDLGLARGVTEPHISKALLNTEELNISRESYAKAVDDVYHFFKGTFPKDHPHASIHLPPSGYFQPQTWILGSGKGSFPFAIKHQAAFCLSIFHRIANKNGGGKSEYMIEFQERYAEAHGLAPQTNICVGGVCASSYEKAKKITDLHQANNSAVETGIIGTPEDCYEQLCALQDKYQVDEIIFLDLSLRPEDRIESLTLLSEATKITVV